MKTVGRFWAGRLFGTNTGNVAAELNGEGDEVTGEVRFLDDRLGAVVYSVRGSFDGANISLTGEVVKSPEGLVNGAVTITGSLNPAGEVRGQWKSDIGTGGTFVLYPHDAPQRAAADGLPEQLSSRPRTVGAVRLYADDVRELISLLGRDFSPGIRVVVTYEEHGTRVSKFAPAFIKDDLVRLGKLKYLKLNLQEHEAHGLNRVASIELSATGTNDVLVQGVQESWVVGKSEALTARLRSHEKVFATTFRRHGLNINGVMLLVTLVLLPELPLWRRAIFLALVVAIAAVVAQLHSRFIPNALIYLTPRKPGFWERAAPQVVSWTIAASAALVGAIGYGLLKGWFPGWLQ
jgi:hypothetical protein